MTMTIDPALVHSLRRWMIPPVGIVAAVAACILAVLLFPSSLPFPLAFGLGLLDLVPGALASFALLYGLIAVVAIVGRIFPAAREPTSALFGLIVHTWVMGWQLTSLWIAVCLTVHFVPRVGSYIRMLFVMMTIFVGTRYLFPVPGSFSFGVPSIPALIVCGNSAMRMVVFAFERPAIHHEQRSVVRTLAYAFGILMITSPTCIAYTTVFTEKPRSELRTMASEDLLWFALKLVVLTCTLRGIYWLLPNPESYFAMPWATRLLLLPSNYLVVVFLASYTSMDFGAAMGCLAGYNMPAANDYPLLSATPMQFWRKLNVHVIDFYRRAVIFETARRFGRSMPVIVLAAVSANAIHHFFFLGISVFKQEPLSAAFLYCLPAVLLAELFVSIYADKVYDRLGVAGRWVMGIFFLFIRSLKVFYLYEFLNMSLPNYTFQAAAQHDRSMWDCAMTLGPQQPLCASSNVFFGPVPWGIALSLVFLGFVAVLSLAKRVAVRRAAPLGLPDRIG